MSTFSHQPLHSSRKDDHVAHALAQEEQRNDWDNVEFVHHALGACDVASVDISTEFAGARWATPFYINAMTGGSHATGELNRRLAVAAREYHVPMASGSTSVALDYPELAHTFTVIREENPDGFIFANIGVNRSVDDAKRAVDLLQANALQVHVNVVQELIMPEGDREFSHWLATIERIRKGVEVPVVVKEVGFGLSVRTLRQLASAGVEFADVSGRGGINFATIENERRRLKDFAYMAGFGQSAAMCLLDAGLRSLKPGATEFIHPALPTLAASGGVRTPLDLMRGLALGAKAVGVAGHFLRRAQIGEEAVVETLGMWAEHSRSLMALLGARRVSDLANADVTLHGDLVRFA